MQRILRSRLILGVLVVLGVAGAVSLPAQAADDVNVNNDNGGVNNIVIPLTKLTFGQTMTLLDKHGITIQAQCIEFFDQTGLCGSDLPTTNDHVAWMFFKNDSASNASAAVGGGDLEFGLCSESPEYGDKHSFAIGQVLNIGVANCSGTCDDLAGAQNEGGNMGFVYQSDGASMVVKHAMAAVNLFGADCAFGAHVDVREP